MTKTIYDYDQAGSIDGATHWLLIQPGDNSVNYNRINRNTLLGVTAQPADISSSQTFSNKILDNSNTVTLKDTLFTLQDNSDTTKQAVFELSGLTTATTRTYTLPDASTTIVGTGATQTLTNKTLTSPTINGGTISNSSVAVDSIAGYSSANIVTIAGLNINNGVLNSNNSVVTANITDGAVTPAKLQSGTGSGWSWASYTPTWTNLTVGNGTVTAKYIQTGKSVLFKVSLVFGTTTSIAAGSVSLTLPVTSVAVTGTAFVPSIGYVKMFDSSLSTAYPGFLRIGSTTTVNPAAIKADSTFATEASASMGATTPFTWASGDELYMQGFYEAA